MNAGSIRQVARKMDRVIELSPHFIRHPGNITDVLRGVHPGNLVALNQKWLREQAFDAILDVGANTGQFARAAHTVFPNARIYSFEPLPECVAAMRQRMKTIPRFQAFASAIGDQDGVVTIHQSASSPSSSILPMSAQHTEAFPWTGVAAVVEVELHTIDHFLPQLDLTGNVLLKIDVQGFSQQVLRGAPKTLDLVQVVLIETSFIQLYEGEASFDDIYNHMRTAGFQFAGFLDHLEHPQTGRILQGDAIFVRPD